MYIGVLPTCLPMYHVNVPGTHKSQNRASDSLELELWIVVGLLYRCRESNPGLPEVLLTVLLTAEPPLQFHRLSLCGLFVCLSVKPGFLCIPGYRTQLVT